MARQWEGEPDDEEKRSAAHASSLRAARVTVNRDGSMHPRRSRAKAHALPAARSVEFFEGVVTSDVKTDALAVRAVRGGS